jgi:hypothetical protein
MRLKNSWLFHGFSSYIRIALMHSLTAVYTDSDISSYYHWWEIFKSDPFIIKKHNVKSCA